MTKQSSFKRAARERARATGQRYTQARADLELANRQEFIDSRPFEPAALNQVVDRPADGVADVSRVVRLSEGALEFAISSPSSARP